jgi:hypothetical protein
VSGSGFSPNASIGIAQCDGEALSPGRCDLGTVVYSSTGGDGTFTEDFVVQSVLEFDGRDCTDPGACIIGAANLSDYAEAGRDWLTFGDPPVVDAGSAEVVEGDDGTTVAEVPVTLSEASGAPVTVSYEVTGGTAESPDDFVAASGALTIDIGETEATIGVVIAGDEVIEPDETLSVTLSDPVHAALGDATGALTILDDDKAIDDYVVAVSDKADPVDAREVGADSGTPAAGASSGGTLPFTGGGSQAPLGLGLVVAGAFALAVSGLLRRRTPRGVG